MNRNKCIVPVYIYVFIVLLSVIPSSFQSEETDTTVSTVTTGGQEKSDGKATEGGGDNGEEEDEAKENEQANQIVILEKGDPYTFLLTNSSTGCMHVTEENIPDNQKGTQSYKEACSSDHSAPFDASKRCKLYTKSLNDSTCLRPTHLLCDPSSHTCVCGNENIVISDIRFQYGMDSGKDYKNGICLIRPTFDYMPGFECAPGSSKKPVTAGENAEPVPVCKCDWENDYDFDKFDTSDAEWWKCGRASLLLHSKWYLVLSVGITVSALMK